MLSGFSKYKLHQSTGDACQDFYIAPVLRQQLSSSSAVRGDGMKLEGCSQPQQQNPQRRCVFISAPQAPLHP